MAAPPLAQQGSEADLDAAAGDEKGESAELKAKRGLLRGELISTEKTYVDSIRKVVQLFLRPLRGERAATLGVSEEQVARIFSNIESILSFHEIMLQELTAKQHPDVPKILLKYADFLKMYTLYLNSYPAAIECLGELRGNARFNEWLLKTQSEAGLDITSFLIMPVQRVPRYVLLLRGLKAATPPAHKSAATLAHALDKLEDIAAHINENKRKVEQMSELLQIQQRISGDYDTLIQPHRHLVREGPLKALCSGLFGSVRAKTQHFFLFNDLLLWTSKPPYRYRGAIQLSAATLAPYDKGEGGFELTSNAASIVVLLPEGEERRAWEGAIRALIQEVKEQRAQRRELQATRLRAHTVGRGDGRRVHDMLFQQLTELKSRVSPMASPAEGDPSPAASPRSAPAPRSASGSFERDRSADDLTAASRGASTPPPPRPSPPPPRPPRPDEVALAAMLGDEQSEASEDAARRE